MDQLVLVFYLNLFSLINLRNEFNSLNFSFGVVELPAGQIAEFLVGFANKGENEMMIDSVEAAFHYPMDHSFVIQNFSAITYGKLVKPKQQATVAYSFIPAEPFAGRPFGLSINLAYRDSVSKNPSYYFVFY